MTPLQLMIKIIEVFENLETPDPNYAQLYRRFRYPENVKPWSTLAERCPPPCRLLDLGCGTGYISIPLLRLGYDVVGVDANPEMLDIAKEVWPSFETINARIEDLDLGDKFDGVIISSPILNFCSETARSQILDKAVEHLKPGGWLGMELFNPAWLRKAESIDSFSQKITCELVDADDLIWYGQIEYYFEDVRYIQRLTIQGIEEDWLKSYLQRWNMNRTEKFVHNRLQYVYVATLG